MSADGLVAVGGAFQGVIAQIYLVILEEFRERHLDYSRARPINLGAVAIVICFLEKEISYIQRSIVPVGHAWIIHGSPVTCNIRIVYLQCQSACAIFGIYAEYAYSKGSKMSKTNEPKIETSQEILEDFGLGIMALIEEAEGKTDLEKAVEHARKG
jgi:hypothetical protein